MLGPSTGSSRALSQRTPRRTLYFDEVRSTTYTDDLSCVFELFLGHDWAGLFHLGGPRPLTLYQIAQVVNRVGGYDGMLLKGCPRLEAGPMPPRAGNVSMDSDKLFDTARTQSVPALAARRGSWCQRIVSGTFVERWSDRGRWNG